MARMAEEEHFDSVWVNKRLLWLLNPRTHANSPDGHQLIIKICLIPIGPRIPIYMAVSPNTFSRVVKYADRLLQTD